MTARDVVKSVHVAGAGEDAILAVLDGGPMPLHEVAARVGRPVFFVQALLRGLRVRGVVVDAPGADGIFRWQLAR